MRRVIRFVTRGDCAVVQRDLILAPVLLNRRGLIVAKAIYAFIVAVAASLVFTATAMAGGTTYGSMKDGHAEAVHNWSGFHVGAALGYSFTDYDHTHDLFD